jgi:hypothetical protein
MTTTAHRRTGVSTRSRRTRPTATGHRCLLCSALGQRGDSGLRQRSGHRITGFDSV